MKRAYRRLLITAAVLILAGCQGNSSYIGEGPLVLAPRIEHFFNEIYMKEHADSGIAAVSTDGNYLAYNYCPDTACRSSAFTSAVFYCESRYKKAPCKIYAIRDKIVWRFPEDQKKTDPAPIIEILKQAKSRTLGTDWAGVLDGQPVTIEFTDGLVGELTLTSEKTGACTGNYDLAEKTTGKRFPGKWSLKCDKGQIAKGKMTLTTSDRNELKFINASGKDQYDTYIRMYLAY